MRQCDLCGSGEKTFLFEKSGFKVVKCGACGLVYVDAELTTEELGRYYSKGYYTGENELVYKDYEGEHKARYRTFLKKIRSIGRMMPKKGRILDVGCAMGFFLEAARDSGWEAHGVEISRYSFEYARKELSLSVKNCGLREAGYPDGYFDVVTIWDAIEHFADPKSELQEAFRILRKGGLLIVTTGDVSNVNARMFGNDWIVYAPPWHLYYFSRKTLARMMADAGFTVTTMRNSGTPFWNDNSLNSRTFFQKIFINRYTSFLYGLLGLGDKITAYARK